MTIVTHCPSVAAGTLPYGSVPVSGISDANTTIMDPGTGSRRGILVFLHPSITGNSGVKTPLPVPGTLPALGENIIQLFTPLVANGWVCVYPPSPQDWAVNGTGYFGNVYNDVATNGNGAFFNETMQLWWYHMTEYLAGKYGAGRPTVIGGFSWGAWQAMSIAIGSTSTLIGYLAHALPTLFENITIFNPPYNTSLLNWTGMDLPVNCLTSPPVTIPGIIGYSDNDGTVGWTNDDTDPHYLGPPLSNTAQIIAAATLAGLPITGFESTSDSRNPNCPSAAAYPNGHLFLPQDATEYYNWFVAHMDPLAPANAF